MQKDSSKDGVIFNLGSKTHKYFLENERIYFEESGGSNGEKKIELCCNVKPTSSAFTVNDNKVVVDFFIGGKEFLNVFYIVK